MLYVFFMKLKSLGCKILQFIHCENELIKSKSQSLYILKKLFNFSLLINVSINLVVFMHVTFDLY